MEDLDAFIDEWLGRRRLGIKPQPAPAPPDYEPVPGLGLICLVHRDWNEPVPGLGLICLTCSILCDRLGMPVGTGSCSSCGAIRTIYPATRKVTSNA